ncbi:hypothetical protein VQ042_20835 [Aurantimonas sp. A2-1-M11]|uniref:hypothetical protein n=1 Tax=Aurantimonas sp. A2-1-M11 TaxID=3113712 RepID=UPI002F93A564
MAISRSTFYGNTDPLQSLGPEADAAPVPDHVLSALAAEFGTVEWTDDEVRDLRVGDVVWMRSIIETPMEDNLGNRIKHTVPGPGGRPLRKRHEDVCVGTVDRVFRRKNSDLTMIRVNMIWSSSRAQSAGRRWSTTISQEEVNRWNAADAVATKRQTRRLAAAGPDAESRKSTDAVSHSRELRRQRFVAALDVDPVGIGRAIEKAELKMSADGLPTYKFAKPVEPGQLDRWYRGEEEPADWVYDVLEDIGVAAFIPRPDVSGSNTPAVAQ